MMSLVSAIDRSLRCRAEAPAIGLQPSIRGGTMSQRSCSNRFQIFRIVFVGLLLALGLSAAQAKRLEPPEPSAQAERPETPKPPATIKPPAAIKQPAAITAPVVSSSQRSSSWEPTVGLLTSQFAILDAGADKITTAQKVLIQLDTSAPVSATTTRCRSPRSAIVRNARRETRCAGSGPH